MLKILNILNLNLKKDLISLVILMFIGSILELIGLGFILLVINLLLGINVINSTFNNLFDFFFINNQQPSIINILGIIVILFTVKLLILIFASFKENIFYANLRNDISNKMYKNFLNRDLFELLKKNSAIYLRNFTEELNLSILFFTSILKIFLDTILLLSFLIFLLLYNAKVTLLVFFIFSFIGCFYFFTIKNKLSKWATQGLGNRKKRIQYITESFSAIKTIKILSREKFFFEKLKKENNIFSKLIFKVNFFKSIPVFFFEYILLTSVIALFSFLLVKGYSNKEIIQLLSVYSLVAFRIVPLINKILGNSQHIRFSYKSIKKITTEIYRKFRKKNPSISKFQFNKKISLNFKSFNFDNKNELLKDINIDIRKKSKIGIVGHSGSGKSTLIDIICGFRKFKKGKFLVDGKSIYKNLEGWQKIIGYIPQNIVIFNDTLKQNILFGANEYNYSNTYLEKLIDKVELEHLVKSKSGINKPINQEGNNISGGEKQRLGIARALINNPEVIVMDEATSGLDIKTEEKILNTIKKLDKTIIIVSHRLSSLKFCDTVYIVKNKTIKKVKNIS